MYDGLRAYLGNKYNVIGVKILKEKVEPKPPFERPKKRMRFCQLVREAGKGKAFVAYHEDISCPNAEVTLGFEEPVYVDVQPRIMPAETKAVMVGPTENIADPDVLLIILTAKQGMDVATLMDGIDAHFAGSLAVCGEATAKPYMEKKPNLSLLCRGSRMFAGYADSEVIFGALPETFKNLEVRAEALEKSCGTGSALCGCQVTDISPRVITTFKKLGFEKGTDYFFGKVNGKNVRVYLNKDFQGKLSYMTVHLPIKGDARVKPPFVKSTRGNWTDVSVVVRLDEIGVELNTGKGLNELLEDVVGKVDA
ncbi:MAG: DUF169 domain-containing protein [Candidatus Hydrothermarchaeales archaeon]